MNVIISWQNDLLVLLANVAMKLCVQQNIYIYTACLWQKSSVCNRIYIYILLVCDEKALSHETKAPDFNNISVLSEVEINRHIGLADISAHIWILPIHPCQPQ